MSEQQSRTELLRQKRDHWKRHIESWQESGLTQTEYCRRNNLKGHQLVYWKKRFVQTDSGCNLRTAQIGQSDEGASGLQFLATAAGYQ